MNTARYETLLRVPGIGVRGARSIVAARRTTRLGEAELRKLGIAFTRARFFITCKGAYQGKGVEYTPEALRGELRRHVGAGASGRKKVVPGQLSLWGE